MFAWGLFLATQPTINLRTVKTTGQMMQTKTTVTRKMTVPAAKAWNAIAPH